MSYATYAAAVTIAMMAIFIGIIVWAWSTKRKKSFDEAANLPLEDDEPPVEGK